jgi:hypothetical protein
MGDRGSFISVQPSLSESRSLYIHRLEFESFSIHFESDSHVNNIARKVGIGGGWRRSIGHLCRLHFCLH